VSAEDPEDERKTRSETRAAFFPFCDYSPERIAAREGAALGARVALIDLPWRHKAWRDKKKAEREHLNVNYLRRLHADGTPFTYQQSYEKMLAEGTIVERGLKPDAKVFAEMVFDVNTDYFENNGGYDFAVQFYEEAFNLAVKEIGGTEYILSAALHADERNKEVSERLGYDVYHYHLHVVYVPVVEKEVLWTKRCKDPALVGTVKEVIPQISHSKKWPIRVPVERDGKVINVNSYSLLQDRYHEHMIAAGYEVERGERGSAREHLTVEEYKCQQEKKRAEEAAALAEAKEKEAAELDKKNRRKKEKADALDKQIAVKEKAKATIAEVDAMGKPQTIGNGFIVTPGELKKLKSLAKKGVGIDKRADEYKSHIETLEGNINDLNNQINSLKNDVKIIARDRDTWKANYERLWSEVKEFIHAIRRIPEKLRAFISEYLPNKTQNREVSL
jgi:hypothetical protein